MAHGLPDDWERQALDMDEQIMWHGIVAQNVRPGRARYALTDILRTNSAYMAEKRGMQDGHVDALFEFLWR
jgi:hypothetical protein